MMDAKVEPALAKRLAALTGEDPACCVDDLHADVATVRGNETFEPALARAKALADEKRFLAAALLKRRGTLCGCEIQAALDLTHATVSHHMRVLVDAGLVTPERRGKWVHYALTPAAEPLLP